MKELGKEEITKMEYGNGFIKFYNCFMEKGEYKLTPREWYFYSLLASRWSPFLGICETTVTAISNVQMVFKDKNRQTRDRTNTWEQIKSLETKGLIKILNDNIMNGSRYNYDQTIRIMFNDFGEGFEQINPELYYLSDDPIEIYFLCVISRFKSKGFSQTYEGLSELLMCSESSINDLVKKLKRKKMITYEQGKRYRSEDGTYTRKANTYYLFRKDEIDNVQNDVSDVDNVEIETEIHFTIFGELTLKEIQRKIKHSNWGTKEYLNENDIDIMLTCEDAEVEESFTKRCRNTLKSWDKKGNDMSSINKWIDNYNQTKENKKTEFEKIKLEKSIVNAVVIDGETIVLDKSNVDKIEFGKADEIYYFDNDKKLMRGNFKYLAGNEAVTDEMRNRAIEEYKKIVVKGEKLTMELIMEIRDRVKKLD